MQEIQRPTVLAGEVKRLISLVHCIAPLMGLHASVLVREALVSCACTALGSDRAQAFQQDALGSSRPQNQQGSRADKQQDMKQEGQHQAAPPVPVVSSIAEWYMTTVVRDHRNIGVSISKARYGKRWQHHHAQSSCAAPACIGLYRFWCIACNLRSLSLRLMSQHVWLHTCCRVLECHSH